MQLMAEHLSARLKSPGSTPRTVCSMFFSSHWAFNISTLTIGPTSLQELLGSYRDREWNVSCFISAAAKQRWAVWGNQHHSKTSRVVLFTGLPHFNSYIWKSPGLLPAFWTSGLIDDTRNRTHRFSHMLTGNTKCVAYEEVWKPLLVCYGVAKRHLKGPCDIFLHWPK